MKVLGALLAVLSLFTLTAAANAAALFTQSFYAVGVCNGLPASQTSVINPLGGPVTLVGVDINIFEADGPIQYSYFALETGAIPLWGGINETHSRAFFPSGAGFAVFPGERGSFTMSCVGGGHFQAYITAYGLRADRHGEDTRHDD
jgi:hypothetical protein